MQTYDSNTDKALKALHDMSCKRIAEISAHCNYPLRPEHLANCYEVMPIQVSQASDWVSFKAPDISVLSNMPRSQKEPRDSEVHHDPKIGQEGRNIFIRGLAWLFHDNHASHSILFQNAKKTPDRLLDSYSANRFNCFAIGYPARRWEELLSTSDALSYIESRG